VEHRRLQRVGDIYDATNPDLRAFAARGGKLLIHHGWSDQAIPPVPDRELLPEVVRWSGGFAPSQTFSRLYMVPAFTTAPAANPSTATPQPWSTRRR
jgi:hypothetical protein